MDQAAPVGHNVHNTMAYAPRTMAYWERHHLDEIYRELFVAVARDRPKYVRRYVGKEMPIIGRPFRTGTTTVLAPPIFDAHEMAKRYSQMYGAPVVQYRRERESQDTEDLIKSFRKFAEKHKLSKKHLIVFNFPACRSEIIECIGSRFVPTNIVEIVPEPQVPFKTRQQCVNDQRTYINDFDQCKRYFPRRSVDLRFGRAPCQSVTGICRRLQKIVRRPLGDMGDHRYERIVELAPSGMVDGRVTWSPRILLIGRRGSGRKTQAALLARDLGVVFVDVDFLILKKIQSAEQIGRKLKELEKRHDRSRNALILSIVHKRVQKPDCLRNGYVVVGFGTCADDLRAMDKWMAVAPNRIMFLHTRERECQRRLQRQLVKFSVRKIPCPVPASVGRQQPQFLGSRHTCHGVHLLLEPAQAHRCIAREHVQYNMNIREMVEYVADRRERRHIDGTHSVRSVHRRMLTATLNEEFEVGGERLPVEVQPPKTGPHRFAHMVQEKSELSTVGTDNFSIAF